MLNGSGNRMPTRWNPLNIPQLVKVQENANEIRVDKVDSSLTYFGSTTFGSAEDEAKWFISRITKSGNITSVDLASDGFNQVWNDRASLTYN